MEEIENNCFPCEENSIYFSYCVQQCYIYHVCYISSTYLSCNRKSVLFLKKSFLAALGLHCFAKAFSSCSKGGLLWFRSTGSSLQRLLSLWSTGSGARGLSSCGSWVLELGIRSCGAWVLLLCGMWDLLGEGLNPCPLRWQANS